jgi:4-hydroxybenzoate polyprenyltransferase
LFLVLKTLRWFKPYCKVCRIESWLSWVFGFGLGNVLFSSSMFDSAVTVLLAFSFATASIFVLNQYFDHHEDEKNVFKSDLPLASGELSPRDALIFSFLLIVSCFVLLSMTNLSLYLSFFLYLALWTLYSAPYPKLNLRPYR